MTKFVEAFVSYRKYLTEGKIYEVINEDKISYLIEDNNGSKQCYVKDLFKEVEAPTKEETNTFKFIPETEITYATVNGVKGILIKEE